jgi:photosystem II stability/assembly factor-like uncharacterized protein
MAIYLSHGSTTIYTSPARSAEVMVGTMEGIVTIKRDNSAAGWGIADRTLTDLHISAIMGEPESGLLFAGAYDGSVHISADGGHTWERRDAGLTEHNVYSIAAARQGSLVRVYVGTEPARIFYSDDLGMRWTESPSLAETPGSSEWSFPAPPHVAHVKDITFHPEDPLTVFASIEVGALLKSTDGGETWHELHGMYEDVHRCVINPNNPDRMYVTGGNGMYVTSDAGATWEHWTTRESEIGGYPDQLVFAPQDPNLMFVSAAHHSPGSWRESRFAGTRISRSRDGGETWEILTNGLPDRMQSSIEAMSLEDWGGGLSLFAATTSGEIFCSDDAGDHWSLIVSGLAPISKAGHYRNLVPVSA